MLYSVWYLKMCTPVLGLSVRGDAVQCDVCLDIFERGREVYAALPPCLRRLWPGKREGVARVWVKAKLTVYMLLD